jgi:hypothetical protein
MYTNGLAHIANVGLKPYYKEWKLYAIDKETQGYFDCSKIAWKGRALSFLDIFKQTGALLLKTANFAESILKFIFVAYAIVGLYLGQKISEMFNCENAKKEFCEVKEHYIKIVEVDCSVELPFTAAEFGIQIAHFIVKSSGDVVGIFCPEVGRMARGLKF